MRRCVLRVGCHDQQIRSNQSYLLTYSTIESARRDVPHSGLTASAGGGPDPIAATPVASGLPSLKPLRCSETRPLTPRRCSEAVPSRSLLLERSGTGQHHAPQHPGDPTVSTVVCGTWGVGGCYPVFNAFSCPCAVLWRLSPFLGRWASRVCRPSGSDRPGPATRSSRFGGFVGCGSRSQHPGGLCVLGVLGTYSSVLVVLAAWGLVRSRFRSTAAVPVRWPDGGGVGSVAGSYR